MIKLLKYDLNSTYESNKKLLNQLDNYIALTEDNQMVHLKPPFKGLIINTNNTGATIYKRTDNQNGKEKITLENGENKLTDWYYGFYFDINTTREQITSFDFSKYDTSNVTNMDRMFSGCYGLTELNISSFNTSNVTIMSNMFSGCTKLTSLDVSKFNTSNVNNMSNMFLYCTKLTTLDVSNFDTSKVTTMEGMFGNCSGLTSLYVSNFDTSKVTNMGSMFIYCSGLTSLDVSSFNTSNVRYMNYMFSGCTNLTYIKCKQAFKDWCWTKQDTIKLPTAMRDGGGGTWEIIDVQS